MTALAPDHTGRFTAAWEHRARLVGLARSRGMSSEDAEDIVSAAILAVSTKVDLDLDRAGAYLSAVVVNACHKEYRRRARFARIEERADPAPGAEDRYCDAAHDAWVIRQVAELAPAQREALQARADGDTVSEIADDLGRSYSATESLLSRARAALRSVAVIHAAVVGAAIRRLRGMHAGPAATAVAANAALLLALLGPFQPQPGSPGAAPPRRLSGPPLIAAPYDNPSSTRTGDPRSDAGQQSRATIPRSGADDHADGVRQVTPRVVVHKGPITYTDGGTTKRHEEKSLLESVQECIERGPRIGPDFIGCPPD